MAFDLVDAVVFALEANQAVTTLFGDTWNQVAQTGTSKFFTDLVDQVPLPYCLITEIGEQYAYMTGVLGVINYRSTGRMQFDVFAASRASTRQLGNAVAKALNDYPLSWPDENNTMEFRMMSSQFIPVNDPSAPGVAIVFRRAFQFEYMYSAKL